jgi:hypothetical protein
MAKPSTAPKPDSAEADVLAELEKIEDVVRAKTMPRVVARVRALADRLEREALIEHGRASLREIHREVEESGDEAPTLDEINAEVAEARSARAARSAK